MLLGLNSGEGDGFTSSATRKNSYICSNTRYDNTLADAERSGAMPVDYLDQLHVPPASHVPVSWDQCHTAMTRLLTIVERSEAMSVDYLVQLHVSSASHVPASPDQCHTAMTSLLTSIERHALDQEAWPGGARPGGPATLDQVVVTVGILSVHGDMCGMLSNEDMARRRSMRPGDTRTHMNSNRIHELKPNTRTQTEHMNTRTQMN